MEDVFDGVGDCNDPVLLEDLWNQLAVKPAEFREEHSFDDFLRGWMMISPTLAEREETLSQVVYRCCAGSCQLDSDNDWMEECDRIFDNIAYLIEHCPIYVNTVHCGALKARKVAATLMLQIPRWVGQRFDERLFSVFNLA